MQSLNVSDHIGLKSLYDLVSLKLVRNIPKLQLLSNKSEKGWESDASQVVALVEVHGAGHVAYMLSKRVDWFKLAKSFIWIGELLVITLCQVFDVFDCQGADSLLHYSRLLSHMTRKNYAKLARVRLQMTNTKSWLNLLP